MSGPHPPDSHPFDTESSFISNRRGQRPGPWRGADRGAAGRARRCGEGAAQRRAPWRSGRAARGRKGVGAAGGPGRYACRAAFSVMPRPSRASTSTAPVSELRRNSRFGTPDSSTALIVRGSPPPSRVTFVPAVT